MVVKFRKSLETIAFKGVSSLGMASLQVAYLYKNSIGALADFNVFMSYVMAALLMLRWVSDIEILKIGAVEKGISYKLEYFKKSKSLLIRILILWLTLNIFNKFINVDLNDVFLVSIGLAYIYQNASFIKLSYRSHDSFLLDVGSVFLLSSVFMTAGIQVIESLYASLIIISLLSTIIMVKYIFTGSECYKIISNTEPKEKLFTFGGLLITYLLSWGIIPISGQFMTETQLGLFAMSLRLGSLISIPLRLTSVHILKNVRTFLNKKYFENLHEMIRNQRRLNTLISGVLVMAVILCSALFAEIDLINFLYFVLPVLLAQLVQSAVGSTSYILNIIGCSKNLLTVQVITLFATILFSLILIELNYFTTERLFALGYFTYYLLFSISSVFMVKKFLVQYEEKN